MGDWNFQVGFYKNSLQADFREYLPSTERQLTFGQPTSLSSLDIRWPFESKYMKKKQKEQWIYKKSSSKKKKKEEFQVKDPETWPPANLRDDSKNLPSPDS